MDINKLVLTPEEIGLLEWESATLNMRFADDHPKEIRAVSLATVKKVVRYIKKNSRESLDYYSPDKAVRERCIPKKVWQEIEKALGEG